MIVKRFVILLLMVNLKTSQKSNGKKQDQPILGGDGLGTNIHFLVKDSLNVIPKFQFFRPRRKIQITKK